MKQFIEDLLKFHLRKKLLGQCSLREGVYLYTMTPSRIANKLRGECSYHTP
jgi:hypothetical protein